jgi:hypothetical protein
MPAMKEMAATSAIPVPVRLALMILRRLCLVMEKLGMEKQHTRARAVLSYV